jgi:hypothetical protein
LVRQFSGRRGHRVDIEATGREHLANSPRGAGRAASRILRKLGKNQKQPWAGSSHFRLLAGSPPPPDQRS